MSTKKPRVVSTEDLPEKAPVGKQRRFPSADCEGSRRRPKTELEPKPESGTVPDPPPWDPPKP